MKLKDILIIIPSIACAIMVICGINANLMLWKATKDYQSMIVCPEVHVYLDKDELNTFDSSNNADLIKE